MAEHDVTLATKESATNGTRHRSAFPQFAIDAVNGRIAKVGDVFTTAADTIDGLFEQKALPVGAGIQDFAADSAKQLRALGERSSKLDAGELFDELQQRAAAQPGLALALGATMGVALAFLLVKSAPTPKAG